MNKLMYGAVAGLLVAGMAYNAAAQGWTDNLKLNGDARFRFQSTDEEGRDTRERWRFRGRIGVDGKVNDQVKAQIRLVTNVGDPISDNVTMGGIGDAFADPSAALDRVNFTWTPADNLALKFGKMGQPWIAVNDLVMSGDANPEGIAANLKLGADDVNLMLHGGGFVLKERSSDKETRLFTGQAAVRFNLAKKQYVMFGGTVYAYDNVKGFEAVGPNNNTTVTVGEADDAVDLVASDFLVLEGFAKAGLNALTLGLQYMVNSDAETSHDTGYLASVDMKLSDAFSAGYQYRYVEKDSTLSPLAESTDFGNSGVDLKGHIPYIKYTISKNFDVKVQYAMGQKGIDSGKDINTFKIDLACKF